MALMIRNIQMKNYMIPVSTYNMYLKQSKILIFKAEC